MALRRFDLEAGGDTFAFKPETEEKIAFWRNKYPAEKQRSAVIPMLWLAQKDNDGWLSEPAMREVADRLEMPYIRVYEVATFYTMFRLQPVGKYHVQLCGTTPCQLRGAEKLKEVCQQEIGDIMYVTDDGRLSWEEVECLGACVNAPMVQINDDYYEDLTPETLSQILGKLKNGVEVAPGPQIDRVNSAPEGGATTLTDPALFDGSKNAITTLPNLPSAEPAEAEAAGKPEVDAPTNTKREEPVASNTKTTLIDTGKKVETGARPAALTIDPASYDDLKRIKGIGPKNEDALNELGIYTFKQIAEWTPENVDWVEDFMSFPGRIEREDWITQAKTLAEGGETEFSKRVDAGDVPSSQEDED
ncbi:NADH-quinone oxidoreductase subunit NuoE [Hyphomonas sp.]|uniref:NADH-quinone oxidoreductase subunit NuoE n=1 Tax=Hyphomonas sp. TaxID=87 RepID=UPI000C4AD3B4|nr:NADH-quinone oxidoreductase subunit NuoE [Hyphomonas sp.]MAU67619.1 NADH-quinone oxidoreductase subunit NuoE [Hyphomonas sp.]MBM58268.1 NADH-quinone oxidoreductase subunit NuoE [Hyphomonas sp.]